MPIINENEPTKEKDEKNNIEADYRALEKNYRAMKLLYQVLSPSDK